ncbi:hypothetical protein HF086_005119 [Spodoptera exigua]|uniref:Uncharacterized protein n=1 Tax=Spodoptera exigua TaxID=7107 RepID=A0A922SLR2_SPOEX|nr:hypothetical protein HF086_005119 [Spodoptera exigua]
MAGVLFIVNVPNKEYENYLKKNIIPSLVFEKEKYERASKVIHELKEKHLGTKSIESFAQDDDSAVVISKCRSTDCLHQNRADSFGCPSESGLPDGDPADRRGYVKASWDELKQAIKPRKNKLTITRPTRGVDVLSAFHWDTPLETVSTVLLIQLDMLTLTFIKEDTSPAPYWGILKFFTKYSRKVFQF